MKEQERTMLSPGMSKQQIIDCAIKEINLWESLCKEALIREMMEDYLTKAQVEEICRNRLKSFVA